MISTKWQTRQSGSKMPLKKAAGLNIALNRHWYMWKCSFLYSSMSSRTRGSKTKLKNLQYNCEYHCIQNWLLALCGCPCCREYASCLQHGCSCPLFWICKSAKLFMSCFWTQQTQGFVPSWATREWSWMPLALCRSGISPSLDQLPCKAWPQLGQDHATQNYVWLVNYLTQTSVLSPPSCGMLPLSFCCAFCRIKSYNVLSLAFPLSLPCSLSSLSIC